MTITIVFTPRKAAPVQHPTWGTTSFMAGSWNGDGYDIRFKYDPDVVEFIKAVIPSSHRRWDQQDKCWSADAEWSRRFATACRQKGYQIVGLSGGAGGGPLPPPRMPPTPTVPVISWADVLLARCPTPELREKVYKQLAKALHADLGGDGKLMQELNDARNSYRQEGTA